MCGVFSGKRLVREGSGGLSGGGGIGGDRGEIGVGVRVSVVCGGM